MKSIDYPFVIYPATEGGYVAEVPAHRGCLAQGDTLHETLDELLTVSELWIESARKHSEKLPSVQNEIERVKHKLAA